LARSFKTVYGSIGNVDLFMGGLAESHAAGAVVGTTFQKIIANQFAALRAGDRFFWLNQGFDSATASMISSTTLADIIKRNTNTTNLQANVFLTPTSPAHVKSHLIRRALSTFTAAADPL
jgi:peroxidase